MENVHMNQTELRQFNDYKRKLNLQAAQAQVGKIEYSLTDATVDKAILKKACQEANTLKLGGICVLPNAVRMCANMLGHNPQTSLIACISFPHGGDSTKIKVKAVKEAIKDGVDESEVTVPVACIKEGDFGYVKREFRALKKAAKKSAFRINIESNLLTSAEITKVCTLAVDCGITSIRTSSGFYGSGFNAETITAIKNTVKDKCTIKADGVSTLGDAEAALDVGASIIGCKNAADLARLVLKAAE